ncbi:MAG: diaminopimelate epimerase [Lachnospiraceae bacterium]|nr:diaminopimelate epimerase [Lachnospiraceae bacterium]
MWHFTKMHGCGNDYVYFDCTKEALPKASDAAVFMSDRNTGIGGDGIILIKKSAIADFYMEMYNLDGSQGRMCGNGIRCVGKFVYDKGLTDKTEITVETLSGVKYLKLFVRDGKVYEVTVDMGHPSVQPADIPLAAEEPAIARPIVLDGRNLSFTAVSMGNPHAVIPVESTADTDVEGLGRQLEHAPLFPEGVNTEFVEVLGRNEVNMRVWERGSGETKACGTGACATAYACRLLGLTDDAVTVHLLGGDLRIVYDAENDTVFMTGPAVTVFEGEIDWPTEQ